MDEYRSSRSFLAIVEREDEGDPENEWALIDALAEDTLPLHVREETDPEYSEEEPDWDVLVLRCRLDALKERIGERNNQLDDRSVWYRLVVAREKSSEDTEAQVVLLGDTEGPPPIVGIRTIARAHLGLAASLTDWMMLRHGRRSPAHFISGLLDLPLDGIHDVAVAAYDVGQGNCNAIVDTHEHPRIFYDIGWPPNFNAKTRPAKKPLLLSCDAHCVAPVVLSHWDMDHWAYAVRSTTFDSPNISSHANWNDVVLRRFWVARPPQKEVHQLGPMHMKLYEALLKVELLPGLSALQLWPDGVHRIPFRHGWIEACAPAGGRPADRNNTGLAMFVVDRRGHSILLPGDADFSSIPTLLASRRPGWMTLLGAALDAWWRTGSTGSIPQGLTLWRRPRLVGLVASHHGGRIDPVYVPEPLPGSPATLVLSVGDGNNYDHPKPEALAAYRARRWNEQRTSTRVPCDRPHAHELGNRLLPFPGGVVPRCGCGCVPAGRICLSTLTSGGP